VSGAKTYSQPQYYTEVSGQFLAQAVLSPGKEQHGTHCTEGSGGPSDGLDSVEREEVSVVLVRSESDSLLARKVSSNYTD
jgi:hypothetical protein